MWLLLVIDDDGCALISQNLEGSKANSYQISEEGLPLDGRSLLPQ